MLSLDRVVKTTKKVDAPSAGSKPLPSGGIWGLTLLAACLVTAVRCQSHYMPILIVLQALFGVFCVAGFLFLRQRYENKGSAHRTRENVILLITGTTMIASVWLLDVVSRSLLESGEAFETRLIASLQQLAMLFCLGTRKTRWREIAFACNLAVVIFVSAISDNPQVVWLAAFFLVASGWWMFGEHWQRLKPALSSTQTESLWTVKLGTILLLVAIVLLFGLARPQTTWSALAGFMPSSGGENSSDPYARSGVGDGEQLVGGTDQADSFGPVETDLFLESDQPTLYDAFNDLYGEPKKKSKTMERAIGLESENYRENNQQLDQSSQEKQGLSTRRELPKTTTKNQGRLGAEVLQLIGASPLHVAIDRFDEFDGESWWKSEPDFQGKGIAFRKNYGKPWFSIPRRVEDWEVPGREHHLRIINYSSAHVPMPPYLKAWHIDKVDRLDFFQWSSTDHLSMSGRESIPSLTIIHVNSGGHRPMLLAEESMKKTMTRSLFDSRTTQNQENETPAPETLPDSETLARITTHVRDLATKYGIEGRSDWFEVESVVSGIRNDFRLAPKSTPETKIQHASRDATDLATFFTRGEGADYLFATTAALVLRELGYATRLVAGYYAPPENYDRVEGVTKVHFADAHVWLEVCVENGRWILLEPTPGYKDSAAVWTWGDRARLVALTTGRFLALYWPTILTVAIILITLWATRARLADALVCGWFSLRIKLRLQCHAGQIGWLGQRRLASVGLSRPRTMSVEQFFRRSLCRIMPESLDSRSILTSMSAHWYRHGPRVVTNAEREQTVTTIKWLLSLSRKELWVHARGWSDEQTKLAASSGGKNRIHSSRYRKSKQVLSGWKPLTSGKPLS
ncbi:MAG: transglutaminase domain-containing protein [Planctomycetota bacterium]|nr:transglutaminase domain-containing protein [Planctomycetota bacterium]